jgi:thioredoxin 1
MKFYASALLFFLFITQPIICDSESEPIRGKIFRPSNQENFQLMLQRYDVIVADFFADWCGPCKQMHKVIEALAQDKDLDEILFIEVDTEIQKKISSQYHVSSLPTIIIFLDGKPLRALYGFQDKKKLKKILLEILRELSKISI